MGDPSWFIILQIVVWTVAAQAIHSAPHCIITEENILFTTRLLHGHAAALGKQAFVSYLRHTASTKPLLASLSSVES